MGLSRSDGDAGGEREGSLPYQQGGWYWSGERITRVYRWRPLLKSDGGQRGEEGRHKNKEEGRREEGRHKNKEEGGGRNDVTMSITNVHNLCR